MFQGLVKCPSCGGEASLRFLFELKGDTVALFSVRGASGKEREHRETVNARGFKGKLYFCSSCRVFVKRAF
jgi:hypothetical protein